MARSLSRRSKLEEAFAEQLAFAALDERRPWPYPPPATEHHFDWCCQHPARDHWYNVTDRRGCRGCERDGDPLWYEHEYKWGRRDWRFDFCWPALKVAVECDGGIYTGGRHTRGSGYQRDAEKFNAAALAGWTVLHVTQRDISSGEALVLVERALQTAQRGQLQELREGMSSD